jgi:hypothetical protein
MSAFKKIAIVITDPSVNRVRELAMAFGLLAAIWAVS